MSLSFELAWISAFGQGAAELGDFLGTLVHEEDHEVHLRMVDA